METRRLMRVGASLVALLAGGDMIHAKPRDPLRFSHAYKAYSCAYGKVSWHPPFPPDVSYQRWQGSEKERNELRERYRQTLEFPYPDKYRGYRPMPHELLALDRGWSWGSCAWALDLPAEERRFLPASFVSPRFRCRLDRVVFQDRVSEERVYANAAQLDLVFVANYKQEGEQTLKNLLPLQSGELPRVFGEVIVRGTHKGRTVYLVHGWANGTPAEYAYMREEPQDFRPDPVAGLPVVERDSSTAFIFGLPEPGFVIESKPLHSMTLYPQGCR